VSRIFLPESFLGSCWNDRLGYGSFTYRYYLKEALGRWRICGGLLSRKLIPCRVEGLSVLTTDSLVHQAPMFEKIRYNGIKSEERVSYLRFWSVSGQVTQARLRDIGILICSFLPVQERIYTTHISPQHQKDFLRPCTLDDDAPLIERNALVFSKA
jgi:hypothetical protein